MALGETSMSQMRLGLKPFLPQKKDGEPLQAQNGLNNLCDVANPFSAGQRKDRQGSEGSKATIKPPAFGTRVPECTFCALRFGCAKVYIRVYIYIYI